MRATVIFAWLFSLASCILGFLTLYSGTNWGGQSGLLDHAYILRVSFLGLISTQQLNTKKEIVRLLNILLQSEVIQPSGWGTLYTMTVCTGSGDESGTCTMTNNRTVNNKPITRDEKGQSFVVAGKVIFIGLLLQIACTGLAILGLPLMMKGKFH